MRYVKLGTTGLDVSAICLGCMSYGEPERGHPAWSLPEDESRVMIKQALDAGINFFDTANMYSQGSSEEITGRALKDFANRDEVVIATKLRHAMRPGPNGAGLSRKAIFTEIDHSLKRLGTDHVDLYQIHRHDPSTPMEETLEALHDVVKAGKVRYLGASSMKAWEFAKSLHLQEKHGWARYVSMQDHYNLLAREEEREMLPLCVDEGVGTIPWSPLARGRLTRPPGEETNRTGSDGWYADLLYSQDASDRSIISAVGAIAKLRGVSPAQIALAWLHSKPVVSAPIVGATKASHLADAVASVDVELTADEIEQLEAPYTPRNDFQGVSDLAALAAIAKRANIGPADDA
jgi:aryl-alcohol dehydrogenase-like predicted oxidoreductase